MDDSQSHSLELVCAQKHPEFVEECINLLNSEWPRSKTARLVSIQQGSSDGFPATLLLIERKLDSAKIVACCKVSPILPYYPSFCFVESVVVSKDLRGRGIGRIIMNKMEDYVKSRGIRTVYLTTHGQQGFYEKLGYASCVPVTIYGGNNIITMCKRVANSLDGNSSRPPSDYIEQQENAIENLAKKVETIHLSSEKTVPSIQKPGPAPPPPPPPPPIPKGNPLKPKLRKEDIIILPKEVKVTMKKELF